MFFVHAVLVFAAFFVACVAHTFIDHPLVVRLAAVTAPGFHNKQLSNNPVVYVLVAVNITIALTTINRRSQYLDHTSKHIHS